MRERMGREKGERVRRRKRERGGRRKRIEAIVSCLQAKNRSTGGECRAVRWGVKTGIRVQRKKEEGERERASGVCGEDER